MTLDELRLEIIAYGSLLHNGVSLTMDVREYDDEDAPCLVVDDTLLITATELVETVKYREVVTPAFTIERGTAEWEGGTISHIEYDEIDTIEAKEAARFVVDTIFQGRLGYMQNDRAEAQAMRVLDQQERQLQAL